MFATLRRLLHPPPRHRPAAAARVEPYLDLVANDVSHLRDPTPDMAPESRLPLPVEEPTPGPVCRAPAISKYAGPVVLRHVPVAEHGPRLLRWLQGDSTGAAGFEEAATAVPVMLLADDVLPAYREMCAELRWHEAAWNQVGRTFRQALGDRKTYAWVTDDDGVRHRLRAYHIPPLSAAVASPRRQPLLTDSSLKRAA